MSHVLEHKTSLCLGNVTKVANGWFQIEKNKFRFDEEFIENYDEDIDKEYILNGDVRYLKKLHELHTYLKE